MTNPMLEMFMQTSALCLANVQVRPLAPNDLSRTLASSPHLALDERDASFVRYVLLVDLDADFPELPERLAPQTQYGRLAHVFALQIPPRTKRVNRSRKERALLLVLVHKATFRVNETEEYGVIWHKEKVRDRGSSQCVDRTGKFQMENAAGLPTKVPTIRLPARSSGDVYMLFHL
ncbi:hypothetical protein FRC09_012785 [Ceratobasidium sp. 395]|nr:hypothetical protein FRC09_012785 [Ceratobasidium sp. 395]